MVLIIHSYKLVDNLEQNTYHSFYVTKLTDSSCDNIIDDKSKRLNYTRQDEYNNTIYHDININTIKEMRENIKSNIKKSNNYIIESKTKYEQKYLLPANNMSYCIINLNDFNQEKYIDITRFKSNDMINYTDIINLGYKTLGIDIYPPLFWQRDDQNRNSLLLGSFIRVTPVLIYDYKKLIERLTSKYFDGKTHSQIIIKSIKSGYWMRKNNKLIQNQEDKSETSDYISIFNQLFNILLHLFDDTEIEHNTPLKRRYKDDTADNSNPKKKKKTRNLTNNDNNIPFYQISTPLMDLVCNRLLELNTNAGGLSEKITIVDTLFNIYSMIYINKYNKHKLKLMYTIHEDDEYRYFIF